ncbi:MAG: hypothetical protein JSS21_05085 [Proteobacteria bacterium]|nr:hypothetical protein [Pseudomonadota bacterium]
MATSKDFKLSMFPRLNIQAGILISGSSPPGYGTAIIGYVSVDTDTDTPLVVILNLLTLSGPEHARPVSFGAGRHVSESAIPKLVINVKLDPKLASKVAPNDTLFVYARAVEGPPMPLAVARIRASSLPSTVTLTDAMAMTPQRKLSSFPQVEVVARISPSGDALPHAGDLESAPVQTATRAQQPIVLTIDRVH